MKLVLPIQFYYEKGRGKSKKSGLAVPTWNHIFFYRRGQPNLTKWAFEYKEKLIELVKEWKDENQWETTDCKTIVNIWVYFPDKRVRDCHNLDKVLLDALEEAQIFTNDRWALVRYMDFDYDKDNPRFELEFEVVK